MMLPMTDESRDIVVNWHNEYRNKIARGYLNDTEYNYIIATNMRVMVIISNTKKRLIQISQFFNESSVRY